MSSNNTFKKIFTGELTTFFHLPKSCRGIEGIEATDGETLKETRKGKSFNTKDFSDDVGEFSKSVKY